MLTIDESKKIISDDTLKTYRINATKSVLSGQELDWPGAVIELLDYIDHLKKENLRLRRSI
ncbi:MAG: hypothetical protein ACXABY_29760 [Candidatus Thorarchaeota archaeon]